MAFFNGKEILLAGLKGDSCFIRYSAHADGTDFTEERSEGQDYIGIATGQTAPTDKGEYEWCMFSGDSTVGEAKASVEEARGIANSLKEDFETYVNDFLLGGEW
jgi:hypothetical protein